MVPHSVLVVEDDLFYRHMIRDKLKDRGLACLEAGDEAQAIDLLSKFHKTVRVALLDIRFPSTKSRNDADAARGRLAGLRLGRLIRERYPQVRLLGMSNYTEEEVRDWFIEYGYGPGFLRKSWLSGGHSEDFVQTVEAAARSRVHKRKPQCFIVHGHNRKRLRELVTFLRNSLGWPNPKVLRDMPSNGRTIIEKFEDASTTVDIVFVLMTPDDIGASVASLNDVNRRARQNVVFELGYFYGKLQRTGGRVIILFEGPLELPTDIAGVVYVNITESIARAGPLLKAELEAWL